MLEKWNGYAKIFSNFGNYPQNVNDFNEILLKIEILSTYRDGVPKKGQGPGIDTTIIFMKMLIVILQHISIFILLLV